MAEASGPALTVTALFAGREERRRHDSEAAELMNRRKEEELAAFRKRLDDFQLTDTIIEAGLGRIRRAFDRGETELLVTSFPSDFCTDGGRAVINANAPPINKLTKEELAARENEPEWLATLPRGIHHVFNYWKTNLKPGGFGLYLRVLDYPGGFPGNIGLFFTWPKSNLDA